MSGDSNFSWVKARSECSASAEFQAIRLDIQADVKLRNEQLVGSGRRLIEVHTVSNGDFFVHGFSGQTIAFLLEPDRIVVQDHDKTLFTVTLTLNDDGECRFKIDGEGEFKRWQVLYKALESLFFEEPQA